MKNLLYLFPTLFVLQSCSPDEEQPDFGQFANGIFIVNEGTFNAGNASITHYARNGSKLSQDIFTEANSIPLGDVAQSMTIIGNKGYIIVNNSGKVEMVTWRDMKSTGTISNLNGPRFLADIDGTKAYLTQMYSGEIKILNLADGSVTGNISVGSGQEEIVVKDGFAYVSLWDSGRIIKINTANNTISAEANVGNEPMSLAFDVNGMLWVLITDTYPADENPRLVRINPSNMSTEATFTFPNVFDYPTDLAISNNGQTLYFLNGQVQSMSINSSGLPTVPFIDLGSVYPYSLEVDPQTGNLWIGDGADFVQEGSVLVYSSSGQLISEIDAGVIPGGFCFTPLE